MHDIDLQQVFEITALLQNQVRNQCVQLDLTLEDENFDELTEIFLSCLMKDNPVSLRVRQLALQGAVDYWQSHVVAYRDDRRTENYRVKAKEKALDLGTVEKYFDRRVKELVMLDKQIQQFEAPPVRKIKR